jgi:DNA-binding response OmpR family regulator
MTKRPLILIVDDEPFNVDYLEQELELLGYQTDSAANGREALEKVAQNVPDLILLDVMMPEIDGFTVCRMLKDDRKTRLIPIVIMTALGETEDRVKGIEAGADDFLTKPVNEQELIARIKTALRSKQAVDNEIGELRKVSDHLTKFVPDAVTRLIEANPDAPELQKHEQDISVLFIDISGYSRLSEKITPEVLNMLVERYFALFLDRIHDSGGWVSETAGDGLMAIFQDGDPNRHAVKATDTALALLDANERLNAENSIQPLGIHMGINSGPALVGPSRYHGRRGVRWVFTADGPVINLAARLADAAKEGEVVAGSETIRRLADRYPLRRVGKESFKNIAEPAEIFHVLGPPSAKQERSGVVGPSGPAPTDRAERLRRDSLTGDADPTPVTAPAPSDTGSVERFEDEPSKGGLPWPDDYRDLKPRIYESWGIEDELYLNRVLSGKSGALVYAVDVTSRAFGGQAILKFDKISDPSWSEEEEADRHRRAVESEPDFGTQHLPKIINTCQHSGKIAILSTIAGKGLEYALPWAECTYDRQLTAVRQLSRGLLEDWNAQYEIARGMQRPSDLFKGWLGYRLDTSAGGRIHRFLNEQCGVAANEPTFMFDGRWHPNPLAFASEAHPLPDRLRLRAATGNIHGDLHGFNVLVKFAESEDLEYYLIDLALYKSGEYLFYDHAYFEMSYLLNARGNTTLRRWKAILDSLGGLGKSTPGSVPSGDDLGLIRVLETTRNEAVEWIERHELNRRSFLESQYTLAQVAVGLNFMNKPLAHEARCKALIYGANSLKHYLKFHSVDWPKQGRSLT